MAMTRDVRGTSLILGVLSLFFVTEGCGDVKTAQQPPSARDVFEMKMKCGEAGWRFDADQKDQQLIDSRYAYNAKLNTCLYSGGVNYGNPDNAFVDRFIMDLATGEMLERATVEGAPGSEHLREAREAFDKLEAGLLGARQKPELQAVTPLTMPDTKLFEKRRSPAQRKWRREPQ